MKKIITIGILLIIVLISNFLLLTGCNNEANDGVVPSNEEGGDVSSGGGTKEGEKQGEQTEEDAFTIAVMSDIHLTASSEIEDLSSLALLQYNDDHQRMMFLSEAIFKSAVDKVIADKVDVVFLAGDLSENGSKASLQIVADQCKKMEDAGIQVFVTCGISDLVKGGYVYKKDGSLERTETVTKSDFREMFADYGYNEANMSDTDTLSYSCDIKGTNYRLNVVDTASLYKDPHKKFVKEVEPIEVAPVATDGLLDFTEEMMMATEEDKKTPLVMSYYPMQEVVDENIGMLSQIEKSLAIDRSNEFEDIFCEYGTEYIFSGHMHLQRTCRSTNFFGEVTNYVTSCLSNYPVPINYYTEKNGELVSKEVRLDKLKEEYLPLYVNEEIKQKVTTDLQSYSLEFLKENFLNKIRALININEVQNGYILFLMELTCIYNHEGIDNAKSEALAEDIIQGARQLRDMPIYGKENSIEAFCAEYGKELPQTQYTTVYDFLFEMLYPIYDGNIRLVAGSDESIIFRYIICSAVRLLADFDIFGRLNDIVPDIGLFDLHPIADTLFETGIIDFKQNEFALSVVDMINPMVYDLAGITLDFESSDTLFSVAEVVIPLALTYVVGEEYDPETNSTWGVVYTDYFSLVTGKLNIFKLLDDVLLDVMIRDFVY